MGCGGRSKKNPTMHDIESHHAAERLAAQNAKRAEEAERARQAAEERGRQCQEDARRLGEEARQARERAEAAEREQQASDEDARRFQREAKERAEEARQSQEKAQQADKERREAAEHARRCQQEAERQEEEARKARDDLKRGARPDVWPTPEQFESTKKRYGYTPDMIHIAVAGISGCGKSSLVNSLRGISPNKDGAAKTGTVETTKVVASYADPDSSKPILWFDIPGAGTLDISDWDYFNNQGLFIFDAIVVVIADRFCATDIAILKACKKYCIPAYIVRSKSDQYIANMIKEEEDADDEDEEDEDEAARLKRISMDYAEMTRRNVQDNLAQAGLADQQVFLISRSTLLAIVRAKRRKANTDYLDGEMFAKETTEKKSKANMVIFDEERFLKAMVGDGVRRRFREPPALMSVLAKFASMTV
ncbi:interferon-inducible GTPase-domain-containing protein [Mucidula mucida]|nr:interferon-inducible GTPase-domain-containing protein [Mucidula mucida]